MEGLEVNYSADNFSCETLFNKGQYFSGISFGAVLAMSLFILIILCFTQKRTKKHKCLFGHPGLPVPMDFLIAPRHRWIYVAVFTVLATDMFNTYFQYNSVLSSSNKYLDIFFKTLLLPTTIVFLLSLQFFPLTACADTSNTFLGHILGLIYSLAWFGTVVVIKIFELVEYGLDCLQGSSLGKLEVAFQVCEIIPIWLVSLFIVLWYIYQATKDCVRIYRKFKRTGNLGDYHRIDQEPHGKSTPAPLIGVRKYHVEHVKTLFRKPVPVVPHGRAYQAFIAVKRYIFPYDRHFKFPVPLLGAVCAMSMLLYQFCFNIILRALVLIDYLSIKLNNDIRPLLNLTGVINDALETALVGLPILVLIAPFLSLVICVLLVIHMIASISKHMKRVAREGFTESLPSRTSRVPAAWKYLGLQIGFFIYAWIIYALLVFVLGVVAIVVYFGLRYATTWTINFALGLLIPIIWARIVFYLQQVICNFVFFDDKKGKFIAITNQRLFNWFSYVLFFYNGFIGFVGAIVRAVISVAFGVLLLFRLDRVVLMKGFEPFDFAHRAYLGFLYLNYTYNNAVVHVFVNLLKETVEDRQLHLPSPSPQPDPEPGASSVACVQVVSGATRSQCFVPGYRSRNRWLVAYTLVRNPSLQKLTANNLMKMAANSQDSNGALRGTEDTRKKLLVEVSNFGQI